MKKADIVVSVNSEAFDVLGNGHYDTTLSLAREIKKRGYDVLFVSPTDYDYQNPPKAKRICGISGDMDIRREGDNGRFYCFMGPESSVVYTDEIPEAALFLIYGTEEMTGKLDGMHEEHYSFLRALRDNGRIGKFLNDPTAERKTVKDAFCEAYDSIPMGRTYMFRTQKELIEALGEYGVLVKKPIFGCRGRGVEKISASDVEKIPSDEEVGSYVFQEFVKGPEKRLILFNKELIVSRIAHNRRHPWEVGNMNGEKKELYNPTKRELSKSIEMMEALGLEIGAVDWIGEKINEVNGSGTGLVGLDENGNLLYDHVSDLVDYMEQYF